MKEIIKKTYEAFDGTIFNKFEDCQAYEDMLHALNRIMFTEDFEPTTYFSESRYIVLNNEIDCEMIDKYCKFVGLYISPFEESYNNIHPISFDYRGIICYNEIENIWEEFSAIRERIESIEHNLSPYCTYKYKNCT